MSKKALSIRSKLAVVRSDMIRGCPFGLEPISTVCCNVGDAIHRMAPLDAVKDDKSRETLTKANILVYINYKTGKQCPFADKVLEDYNKVDCDFEDTGQGLHSSEFQGSPIYPQTFSGVGLDGLYGHPLGFYADNNESRNLFFGLFSYLGRKENVDQLIKLANDCYNGDNVEAANKLNDVIKDLQDTKDRDLFEDKMRKLENFISEYKQQYKDREINSGLLFELAEKWFGPRQVSR